MPVIPFAPHTVGERQCPRKITTLGTSSRRVQRCGQLSTGRKGDGPVSLTRVNGELTWILDYRIMPMLLCVFVSSGLTKSADHRSLAGPRKHTRNPIALLSLTGARPRRSVVFPGREPRREFRAKNTRRLKKQRPALSLGPPSWKNCTPFRFAIGWPRWRAEAPSPVPTRRCPGTPTGERSPGPESSRSAADYALQCCTPTASPLRRSAGLQMGSPCPSSLLPRRSAPQERPSYV